VSANTGSYTAYLKLEDMVSRCESFQDLVGAANATEAKARIKFISCQDFDTSTRGTSKTYQKIPCPRCAIWNVNPSKTRSSTSHFTCQLNMVLTLEIEIPSNIGPTEDEQFRYCGPLFQDVEDDLAALALIPGEDNLDFQRIGYLQSPGPVDPTENNGRRLWVADLSLQTRW